MVNRPSRPAAAHSMPSDADRSRQWPDCRAGGVPGAMDTEGPPEGLWIAGRSDQGVPRRRAQPLAEPVGVQHRVDRAKSGGRNQDQPGDRGSAIPKDRDVLGPITAVGKPPEEETDDRGGVLVEPVDKPYASGVRPITVVRYSGNTAAVDSEETSVTRLTTPSSTPVGGTDRRPSGKSGWPGAPLGRSLRHTSNLWR